MDLDQIEAQRTVLTGHCYRMLGSAMDADDAVQETMIRAWKGLHQFDGRASLRTWLYRIATNVCLDEIAKRGRRAMPMEVTSVPEVTIGGVAAAVTFAGVAPGFVGLYQVNVQVAPGTPSGSEQLLQIRMNGV